MRGTTVKSIYKILILMGFFTCTALNAEEDCKHKIFFLPQSHDVQNIPNAGLANSARQEVAASQLKIVNYLDRFPQRPVFSEQATTKSMTSVNLILASSHS